MYLIGAGPGDPGSDDPQGERTILARADVIIYDYLANKVFLDYGKPEAERIYVGKKGGDHTMGQADINRLIVEKSKAGNTVARLKGGDPFIFGRGGEEAQELVADGVPFEVVPGITSAISVPAYAGIPLTHRDHTATVAFVTGHEDPFKEKSNIHWDKLATGVGTLVFLMGVGNLSKIAENLIHHGRSPKTPVAVIRRGDGGGTEDRFRHLERYRGKSKRSRLESTGHHRGGGCGPVAGGTQLVRNQAPFRQTDRGDTGQGAGQRISPKTLGSRCRVHSVSHHRNRSPRTAGRPWTTQFQTLKATNGSCSHR